MMALSLSEGIVSHLWPRAHGVGYVITHIVVDAAREASRNDRDGRQIDGYLVCRTGTACKTGGHPL